jgi:L,D-peptidoglycan transpeptidase YkuD (ErfK/YbiS/YcfS/YnhG family)
MRSPARRDRARVVAPVVLLLTVVVALVRADPAVAVAGAVHPFGPTTADQVVVVSTPAPGSSRGTLTAYAWAGDHWQATIGPVTAWVGANGLTADPHEADGFTPVGQYSFTILFGAQPDPGTAMGYVQVGAADHWVDDPSSAVYNTWQQGAADGRWHSAENLSVYPYAAAFDFNQNPVVPDGNSAIFLHQGAGPTPGCIEIDQADLLRVMRWLTSAARPQIVIGVNASPPRHLPGPTTQHRVAVAGQAGVPVDAQAVIANITVTDAAQAGYVTVWPCGQAEPGTSNANFAAGATVADLTITAIGTDGAVCVDTSTPADVIVDVEGYVASSGTYRSTTPTRWIDTRDRGPGPHVTLDAPLALTVPADGPVPLAATMVAVTVTVTDAAAAGYLTVWPCAEPRPLASNADFAAGQTVAAFVVVGIDPDRQVCTATSAPADVIVDVEGYATGGSPVGAPDRLLDTRDDGGPVRASVPVAVPGTGGADGAASAAIALDLAATDTTADGYALAWPCASVRPTASTVGFSSGATVANVAIVPAGSVCVTASAPSDLVVDREVTFDTASGVRAFTPVRVLDTRT